MGEVHVGVSPPITPPPDTLPGTWHLEAVLLESILLS